MAKAKRQHEPPLSRPWVRLLAVVVCLLGVGVAVIVWPRHPSSRPWVEAEPATLSGASVLLVTIDTLRADHLGCYGNRAGLTPRLDALAREAVRFENAFSHAVMTLPSHASLLTGTYPTRHGVRDNGARLRESSQTLAEILKARGYRTGAFVGAFVLDARFGLNQGFDRYDDYYGEKTGFADFHFVERRAEEVLAAAQAWISEGSGPYFAWVHLFDPHAPYLPPSPYREKRGADLYAGEVEYTDAALGRFLDELRAAGRLEKTLVVVTADHGESLGDHGEKTHGTFAYNATLRVPVLLWSPLQLSPGVVSGPVGLVDLAATLLDLVGVEVPSGFDGRSVLRHRPRDSHPIYFEALHGYLSQGAAPLTGVVEGTHKYVDLPIPELYDLASDPDESHNLSATEPTRVRTMKESLAAITRAAEGDATAATPDAETRRLLAALGYVSGPRSRRRTAFTEEDDPKRLLPIIEAHRDAMERYAEGAVAEAVRLLENVIARRPANVLAYMNLASILAETGRLPGGIALVRRAAEIEPENGAVLARLGTLLSEAGALEEAARVLDRARSEAPDDLDVLNALGVTYARMGRPRQGEPVLERALQLDPSSATTWSNLGSLYLAERNHAKAIEAYRRAIEIEPRLERAHEGIGGAYLESGRRSEAVAAWVEVLRLNPSNFATLFNVGALLVELGRAREAEPYLERFLREAPEDRYRPDKERLRLLLRSGGSR